MNPTGSRGSHGSAPGSGRRRHARVEEVLGLVVALVIQVVDREIPLQSADDLFGYREIQDVEPLAWLCG